MHSPFILDNADLTAGVQRYETALECTYRFRFLGDALFLQPDLQYIIQPSGRSRVPDALAVNLQTGINL